MQQVSLPLWSAGETFAQQGAGLVVVWHTDETGGRRPILRSQQPYAEQSGLAPFVGS